jgi:hypothetical protein
MNPEPLSEEQLSQFDEHGYLVLPALFSNEEIGEMAREADRIRAFCINASLAVGRRDPRLDIFVEENDPESLYLLKLQPVKDLSACFERLSEDERLIAPMRQILGCEPILMEEKLNYKQRVDCPAYRERFDPKPRPSVFHLHHDWGYYRQQGYPPDTLSSAITIDEVTSENGPIRVIPGTHKQEWPLKDPEPTHGNGTVEDGLFAEEDRVEMLAPAGSVMIFHSRLLHDSTPNRTGGPRRIMIYSHYPGNYSFEEDLRNRGGREAGQALEAEYMGMKQRGEFVDLYGEG